MNNTIRIASLAILASLCATTTVSAQSKVVIRARMSAAPTNNGSDNTGVNTGSSSGTAGGTFTPGGTNASTPNATTGAPAGGSSSAPNGAGVTVSSSGNVSGTVTNSSASIVSGLSNGSVSLTMSSGGTITVTIPAAAGATIANAISNPSPANGQAAGQAAANVLSASGLPGGVVTSVANAVAALGTNPSGSQTTSALSQAVASCRAAIASGAMTPDQAKGLVAVLVAMRAAAGH